MPSEADVSTCALCGEPIEPGEAWMVGADGAATAHCGCVYRDEAAADAGEDPRWRPADAT